MIVKSDFQTGDVDDLLSYISEDEEEAVQLRDSAGRKLTEEEIEAFVERSQAAEMQRQFIVAPDPAAEYTASEVGQHTRSTLNGWKATKPSVEYVYGVHGRPESGKSHAHAAAIGKKRDLRMDQDDLRSLRERAREAFAERQRLKSKEREQEKAEASEQEPEIAPAKEVHDDV